jgi:hypothetical protein
MLLLCTILGAFTVSTVEGCGNDPTDFPCHPAHTPCPEPYVCLEDGRCELPDAGTDAGDAGEGGTSSAIGCTGPSLPYPPDGWDLRALWHGPSAEAPQICPELGDDGQAAFPLFHGHADIAAPPANCDPCKCSESSGTCSKLPDSIEVHAATCGAAGSSSSFAGPEGWDGSCTDANALPAGAMCNGALCAQSIAVSPLGAPEGEACEPFADPLPVANYGLPAPTWTTTAIGCRIPTCHAPSKSYLSTIRELPEPFRACVSRKGEHTCPVAWKGERFLVYEVTAQRSGYIDGRECTACACSEPVGGACLARLRTFEDGACSKLISDEAIASFGEQCTNVLPAGLAIGSKEITPPEYLPGACEPSGGEPIGDVEEDPEQAVTFCCRPPEV